MNLSLCSYCHCMTKTIKSKCGKCKEIKMQKNKLEVMKVDNIMKCWTCDGKGYIIPSFRNVPIFGFKNKCKTCKGTGLYNEYSYIHIVNGMAFRGDTIK